MNEDELLEDLTEDVEPSDMVFEEGRDYRAWELEQLADNILRADTRRELCRQCDEYGEETGHIESQPQTNDDGSPLVDNEGQQLYVDFPELQCNNDHVWYKGEGKARGNAGKDPILFEEHLKNRQRREIYTSVGTPDPEIVSGLFNRCVDDQTQALTPTGWRSYFEIEEGDRLWAYDPSLDRCGWMPTEAPFVNHEFEGIVQVLESQNISARTTEGHSWIVVHERDKESCVVVNELLPRHYIPTVRPSFQGQRGDSQEALFELLGWVITDGTYANDRNRIVAYQAMHNPKVVALQACLKANGLSPEPSYINDATNVGHWHIENPVAQKIRNLAPTKRLSDLDLSAISAVDREALLSGVVAGDGYVRELSSGHVCREVYSTNSVEADAVQALVTVQGIPSKLRRVDNPEAFCPIEYTINLKNSRWAYVRAALREPEAYSGTVWCPTVPSGFWVARRNGTVYITGNTHPQGRKVNSADQRRKHGASFYR